MEDFSAFKEILKTRFEENKSRHEGLTWEQISEKLNDKNLSILQKMEETGGEPDVVIFDGEVFFADCSAESPKERRSLCYDREALDMRKESKPKNSAIDLANEIGAEMLTEQQYFELQSLGTFDSRTSSWLKTPENIRKLGGAIFGDFRYGTIFI